MSKKWVREDDWSKVYVGDRVKLINESGDYAVVIVRTVSDSELGSRNSYFFKHDGQTLYVRPLKAPEKAPLPQEPGMYVDQYGVPWILHSHGYRYRAGNGVGHEQWPSYVTSLTRLEPVPETAAKVLNALWPELNVTAISRADVQRVARQFGVTE